MSMYRKGENVMDFYKFEEELGSGSFAIVRRAVSKQTGDEVAVKIIDRKQLEDDDELSLQNEIEILS